jgi:hypothetical protein
MIIRELKNPLTEEYSNLKNIIFEGNFPWYMDTTTGDNLGKYFFGHKILNRPSKEFPASSITSDHFGISIQVLNQIAQFNNLNVNLFLRIHVNLNVSHGGGLACSPHHDHDFPHKNLLIYLNQASGPTVVINSENNSEEYFHPKEDVIITFEGKHYHYQPNVGEKRIVLVATYI